MGNPEKNLLMMFVLAMLIMLSVIFWGAQNSYPAECPAVPDSSFSPSFVVQSHWDAWVIDMQNGFTLVLARNKRAGAIVSHAMGLYVTGSEWPGLFNYVEEGVIKFLRYDAKLACYVWDETVNPESYDVVAEVYRTMLKVDIAPRRGA
jgi:hypothetical protein